MADNKSKQFTKTKMLLTIIFMTILSLFVVIFFIVQSNNLTNNILQQIKENHTDYTHQIANRLYKSDKIEDIVSELKDIDTDGSKYWIAYYDGKLLFEKDDLQTKKLGGQGIPISDITEIYIRNGANENQIKSYQQKLSENNDFNIIITRDATLGKEIISFTFFNFNGKTLALGNSVSYNTLISKTKYNLINLNIKLAIFAIITISFILVGLLSILLYLMQNKFNSLSKELQSKNKLLHENNLDIINKNFYHDKSLDYTTGLYSREFLTNVLSKLSSHPVSSIGLITVSVDNGNTSEQQTSKNYKKIADVIKLNSNEKNICCRISSDLFLLFAPNIETQTLTDIFESIKNTLKLDSALNFDIDKAFCDNQSEMREFVNKFVFQENKE